MFLAQSWELAIIGEWPGYRKATVFTPSHALDAKFSLIIVGWWRLRISDGKFVKHTTEMILWSMILTFTLKKYPTPQSYFHAHILNFQAMLESISDKKVNIWFRMFPIQALNEILRLILIFMTPQLFHNDAKCIFYTKIDSSQPATSSDFWRKEFSLLYKHVAWRKWEDNCKFSCL